ncbi:hypothetical protein JG687_00007401 [Phytophthora cactorum]|uniref:Cation-transporting P-type ATPase N-terminal domain-containing protein n=1 Tax=Phytophthora cactorum TaxID=29920 RepID=A0A8T1UFB1_9STRA|nr:hypothetical protein JG687_00007401 [Phytophthora cactorum]
MEEVRKLNQDQMTETNLEELARIGGVTALATLLCVNVEHGLPRNEIDTNFTVRRGLFGRNVFPESPMKGLFRLFVESLQDTTLIILIIAAIASMVTGYMEHPETGWSEGVAILFGVILVAAVTSVNNYTKEKQFRALSAKNDDVLVKVLRDGKPDQVPVGEISVGEVIILETGDRVPADAVLINGSDLKCNESSLTGEPDDVSKAHKKDPFLLSSCLVASGRGECLVIAVGTESRWGKIKSKLACEQKATPLMEKLEEMAKHIGYVGMAFSIATMVAMIIIYATSDDKKLEFSWPSYILHTFLIGVTIIVVAIPEGLPLAVTISLSYSTKKMLRDNNLIRVLAACETMGNVTSICSDKTGTLTENKMTVVQGWVLGKFFKDEFTNASRAQFQVDAKALEELAVNIAVNTSAYLKDVNDAPQCGIMTEDGVALEGPVFRAMSVEDVSKLIPRLQVLARSSPDDKFRLVNLLKDRSEVVGVTGDGTNDAPALRTADVGMAMGITGTDLAKEASDIIIMDDKFSSIRKAVLWGRCVYDNIRKFLQFQLTVNIVALVVTFVSAVTGKEPPLNSVMMLWINLIMDTMGALALGTEAPTEALLDRRPYKKSAKLLGRCMVKNIVVQSILTCDDYATNSTVLDYPVNCLDDTCTAYDYRHYTIIFNTFVFSQLFNEFNARKTNNDWQVFNGLVANPLFIMIILITLFVQVPSRSLLD